MTSLMLFGWFGYNCLSTSRFLYASWIVLYCTQCTGYDVTNVGLFGLFGLATIVSAPLAVYGHRGYCSAQGMTSRMLFAWFGYNCLSTSR